MRVSSLRLQNFRLYDDISLDFSPRTTIITGKNGTGKTSIVEAVYVALKGVSFKGNDDEIRRHGTDWYRIDLETTGDRRTIKYQSKKTVTIDTSTHHRIPAAKKYPIVLFEPDMLHLLHDSPTRRRDYIDVIAANLDPAHATLLRRYERALRQRNAALKQRLGPDSLFSWNITLAEYGARIIEKRQEVINHLSSQLSGRYNELTNQTAEVTLQYSENYVISKNTLLASLDRSYARDSLLGYTTVGPHRHDVIVRFDSTLAAECASRGEMRSIILALKLAETKLIETTIDKRPIVIFDDVYSELDESRQARITELANKYQTIITSVAPHGGISVDHPSQQLGGLRVHHL